MRTGTRNNPVSVFGINISIRKGGISKRRTEPLTGYRRTNNNDMTLIVAEWM